MRETCHIPVMEQEVLEYLRASTGGTFLDCTLGGGGHSAAILKANLENRLTSIDRDMRAIERAAERLACFGSRSEIHRTDFAGLAAVLKGRKFDGVLVDLGLSSDQLAENRGFSFGDTGDLDMRMDESSALRASQIVNEIGQGELYRILKQGGVGREARAAASAIVKSRPISTSRGLADLLGGVLARYNAKKKVHPATVVFQAIRMAVNDESGQLQSLLQSVPSLVNSGGRLVVISFHSLEDKLAARAMRDWSSGEFSALWPGSTREKPRGTILTRRALVPSAREISSNPAARSARMRAFEFN